MVLMLFFAAVGGLAMTVLFALCPTLSFWWCLPIWLGFSIAVALTYILVVVLGLYLFLPKENPSLPVRRFTHGVMKLTLRWVLVMLGVRVKVTGADRLPDTPYLLVGNHRSAFDPICSLVAFRHDLVFVAKPSVLNIPIIGSILERLCFMGIDRENARNAVATIKRSAECIQDIGLCVGIYPEGTRSRDGNLLPLHAGSFKIAKLANCPVAVVSVRVTKGLFFPSCVELRVVDMMNVDCVAEASTAQMAERTEQVLREDLGL